MLPEECLVKNRLQMSDMQIWSIKNQPVAGPLVSDNNHKGAHGAAWQLHVTDQQNVICVRSKTVCYSFPHLNLRSM